MPLVNTLVETDEYKFASVYRPKDAADALIKAGRVDAIDQFEKSIEEYKNYLSGSIRYYLSSPSTIAALTKELGPGLPDANYRNWDSATVRKKLEQKQAEFSAFLNTFGRTYDPFYAKGQIRGAYDQAVSYLRSSFSNYTNRLYQFIKKRDGVGPTNLNLKDRPNMIKEILDMIALEIEQNKAATAAAKAANAANYVRKCKRCPSAPLKPPTVPPVDNKKLNNRLNRLKGK